MDIRRWKMGGGRVGAGGDRGDDRYKDLQMQLCEKAVYRVNCIKAHHVNRDIWQWGPSLVENLKPVSVATTQWVVKIGSNLH